MPNRALHVLILPKWYPNPDDPQLGNFIAQFAKKLAECHLVSVVYPFPLAEPAEPEFLENGNLLEIRVPYVSSLLIWSPIRKMINYTRYRRAMDTGIMHMLSQRNPPDLIHAQVLIRPALFAGKLSQHWEIPWMLTEHGSVFLRENALSGIRKKIIRQFCKSAAHLITVSPPLAQSLSAITERDDVKVIPNLIEFNATPAPPSSRKNIRIGIVADLVDDIKNISGVLRAISRSQQQLPPFELQIVGDGPDGEMLKKLTEELNLLHCVSFLGRKEQPEVMNFLSTVNFLITNSRTETFSIVSAEAIACGKPVIVTRCGGPEHWFRKEYGMLIDPDQPEQLEAAIVEMCRSYRNYDHHQMATNIRKQFDADDIISQYETLYYQIAGE